MTQGELIVVVFAGVVCFLSGLGAIFAFIKTYITEPQLESVRRANEQRECNNQQLNAVNNQLKSLNQKLEHQNEMTMIRLEIIDDDIRNVVNKVVTLDGRV